MYNQHQQRLRYLVEFSLPGDEKGGKEEEGEEVGGGLTEDAEAVTDEEDIPLDSG